MSLVSCSSILAAGSTFMIYILLARELGVYGFGLMSSALTMATFFALISGFGVSQFWLRIFGESPQMGRQSVLPSLKCIALTCGASIVTLIIWACYGPNDYVMRNILIMFSVYMLGQVCLDLVISKMQIEREFFALSIFSLFPNLARLALVSVVVFFVDDVTVIGVAYIYLFVSVILVALSFIQLIFWVKKSKGSDSLDVIKYRRKESISSVFVRSWPFGVGVVCSFVYMQSDIVILKYLSGDYYSGLYNVAFVFISAVILIPNAVYQKYLMPMIHHWAYKDSVRFREVYILGRRVMLAMGLVSASVLFVYADWLIVTLFGSEYAKSGSSLKILVLMIPMILVGYSIGAVLSTKEFMIKKVRIMVFVAVLNILLNMILIPKFNADGAAIATVVSYFLLLTLYYVAAKKYVFSQKENLRSE